MDPTGVKSQTHSAKFTGWQKGQRAAERPALVLGENWGNAFCKEKEILRLSSPSEGTHSALRSRLSLISCLHAKLLRAFPVRLCPHPSGNSQGHCRSKHPSILSGTWKQSSKPVNVTSALRSLTFNGGRPVSQQACTDDTEKSRSGEGTVCWSYGGQEGLLG